MSDEHFLLATFSLGMLALVLCVLFGRLDTLAFRRRHAQERESRRLWARRLADATFEGLLIHRSGNILSMNRSLLRLLGCREVELAGQHFSTLAPADQVTALRAELDAPSTQVVEFILMHSDGTERLVEMSSHTIDHEGMPASVTAIRDISRSRADQLRIEKLLHHDPLTGLANRAQFIDRLRSAIAANDRSGGTTALLTIDLDQFKAMNEKFGRAGGDALLRQIAGRLSGLTQDSDTVARLSGDKFGIVQPHTGAPNRALSLASKLETAFGQPFMLEGQPIRVSVSIGIAVYPDHAADADALIKASNFALRLAAQAGGGGSHVFSHTEAEAAQAGGLDIVEKTARGPLSEAQRLANDLRSAIPGGEISCDYQPIFHARDLSLAGFEALARWRHKTIGLVPPMTFIPLAEQAGLIHEIGGFVLESACMQAAGAGPAGGQRDWVMSVNLSPMQFRDPQLSQRIGNILKKTGLKPAQLELEVTESLLIDNAEAAKAALTAIRALGVSVALDDFGTGYSSLSYLCDFPFTRLKIDKRFVQALGRDSNAEAVIGAILSLASNLNLQVTAEGVETPGQLAYLQELGCHLVQGFLLGRPAPHVSVTQALSARGAAKPSLVIANG